MSRKKTHKEYIEELAIKNPIVEVVEPYITNRTPIMHHCLKHDVYWKATPSNVLSGKGCNKCLRDKISSRLVKTHDEYVEELKIKNPTVIVVDQYINHFTPITHYCLKHGTLWKMTPANALRGNGCQECKKEKLKSVFSKTHEQYVRDVANVNPDIEVIGEYINAYTPILHRCKFDGAEWMASPSNILSGRGCPRCKESNIERRVRLWLDNNGISYVKEKIFDDCKDKQPLPFDFYLEDHNTLIEVQGHQHYHPVDLFGGDEAFELQQKHDMIKKKYCETHNIRLLCIPYNKDVSEELNNFLFI